MKTLFLKDYKTAESVRVLGFDLPCFGIIYPDNYIDETYPPLTETMISRYPECIKLPMYEQVFEWLRTKYNIHIHADFCMAKNCDRTYYVYKLYYKENSKWQPVAFTGKDPRQSALVYAINLLNKKG